MKFKQILRQVRKLTRDIEPSVDWNKWINMGMEEIQKRCVSLGCSFKAKNSRGLRIHMAKKHGWTKIREQEIIDKSVQNYKENL